MLRKSKDDDEPAVLQLQRMASDSRENLVDLLRKALAVATKLKLEAFAAFIKSELNGYPPDPDAVPPYRLVGCSLKATNPATGRTMPVFFQAGDSMAEHFSRVPIYQPVGELAPFFAVGVADGSALRMSLSVQEQQYLITNSGFRAEAYRQVSTASIAGIDAAIRNTILDWALKLEENGILGEGMTFTAQEKEKADNMTINVGSIGNMQGNIGPISNSQVTQNLEMHVTAQNIQSLQSELARIGVTAEDFKALQDAIAADPKPTSQDSVGPKVGAWIGGMVGKAATGVLKIGTDVAAKFLMAAVMQYYGMTPPPAPH